MGASITEHSKFEKMTARDDEKACLNIIDLN